MPQVSVIIPVYNTSSTLSRCIDSVLAQSFADLEIVLVDDGSTDNSSAICDRYASQHSQISVVHQQNAGLAEARRQGIHHACGTYVVHLDSDDTLPSDSIETLHRHLVDDQLDMAYGCFCRIVGKKQTVVRHQTTGVLTGDEFMRMVLSPGCICASWASISRRELWTDEVFPPSDTRLPSEDVFTQVMMSEHLQRVGLYNDIVYEYHANPQSLTATGSLHQQDLWETYFHLIRKNLSKRGVLDTYEPLLQAMEIDRLAFYTHKIDRDNLWYRVVLQHRSDGFTAKTRVLQLLLHWPWLMYRCIGANRLLKRLSGKA